MPVADGDVDVLDVLLVTEIKVVLTVEELLLTGVVEIIIVLEVAEVLELTELLSAVEVLEVGAGLPDFNGYVTPVAGQVDCDPTNS